MRWNRVIFEYMLHGSFVASEGIFSFCWILQILHDVSRPSQSNLPSSIVYQIQNNLILRKATQWYTILG